jgi:ubiquinone/menaquinone biosynthesis C-methylase UbiE
MSSVDDGSDPVDQVATVRSVFEARDRHAGTSLLTSWSHLLTDERRRFTEEILRAALPDLPTPAILDVGCGGGTDLAHWLGSGWPADRLAGIDLVPGRVDAARHRCPGVDIRLGGAGPLPFGTGAFDVATASTVLSSIADAADRQALFAEMRRVVRPGGLIIIYDFVVRNPRNPHVLAMTMTRLVGLAGRPPEHSRRLSPFLYAVSLAGRVHPRAGRAVALVAPRTHRLSWWRAEPGT